MSLVLYAKRPEVSIAELEYMALRYVWEREKLNFAAVNLMQHTLVDWHRYAEWSEDDALMRQLEGIGVILKAADEGKYEDKKRLYKEHKLDWRKIYNVPGAHTLEDYIKAQEMYEEYKKENPEQEK